MKKFRHIRKKSRKSQSKKKRKSVSGSRQRQANNSQIQHSSKIEEKVVNRYNAKPQYQLHALDLENQKSSKESKNQSRTVHTNQFTNQINDAKQFKDRVVDNGLLSKSSQQLSNKRNKNKGPVSQRNVAKTKKSQSNKIKLKSQKQDKQNVQQSGEILKLQQLQNDVQSQVIIKTNKIRRQKLRVKSDKKDITIAPNKEAHLGMRKLGVHKVLGKRQEAKIAHKVYKLVQYQKKREILAKELGREPNMFEWALVCNITDMRQFKEDIQQGQAAQRELVRHNTRLVTYMANRYPKHEATRDDLISAGLQGLSRAVEMFNPNKGFKFVTYAPNWIRQTMNRSLENQTKTIRIPATYYCILRNAKKLRFQLMERLQREPTLGEIAEGLNITQERLEMVILRAKEPRSIQSLSLNLDDPSTTQEITPDSEENGDPSIQAANFKMTEDFDLALDLLEPQQAQAIRLKYGLTGNSQPVSLRQISRVMKVSVEVARQLINCGLEELSNGEMGPVMQEYASEAYNVDKIPARTGIRR
eukprot:TRINITY_DN3107_c0_g1_i13.p2 TRINITY_DN3107_c0_g1~~TRINITY_DN3107_c0_g1_i13.p2  ORF type:complete len:548 (-),score=33.12 TRINITY_DN3107_c0_g1_i13:338-1924(-)